jgi:hypothetical protein
VSPLVERFNCSRKWQDLLYWHHPRLFAARLPWSLLPGIVASSVNGDIVGSVGSNLTTTLTPASLGSLVSGSFSDGSSSQSESDAPPALPKGFSICFYDEKTGETVACPRDYSVQCIGRQHYLFAKNGQSYSVDLEEGTCSCPDFMVRKASRPGSSCKHMRLARALFNRGVLPNS